MSITKRAPVSKKRIELLKKHLLDLEDQTGRPLRNIRRFDGYYDKCPILQFAPDFNKDDQKFFCCSGIGNVYYGVIGQVFYSVYEESDSNWWLYLSRNACKYVLEQIEQWLATRTKEASK